MKNSLYTYIILAIFVTGLWHTNTLHARGTAFRYFRTYPSYTCDLSLPRCISVDAYGRSCILGTRGMVSCARVSERGNHDARFLYVPLDSEMHINAHLPAGVFWEDALYLLANTHVDVLYPNGEFCKRITLSPPLNDDTAANVIDMALDGNIIHVLSSSEADTASRSVIWRKYSTNGTLYGSSEIQLITNGAAFLCLYSNDTAVIEYDDGVAFSHSYSGHVTDDAKWEYVTDLLMSANKSLNELKCNIYYRTFINACIVSNGMYILSWNAITHIDNKGDVLSVTPLNQETMLPSMDSSRIVFNDNKIFWLDNSYHIFVSSRNSADINMQLWHQKVNKDIRVDMIYDMAYDQQKRLWLLTETCEGCIIIVTDGTNITYKIATPPDAAPPYAFIHGMNEPLGIVDRENAYILNIEQKQYVPTWPHTLNTYSDSDDDISRISAASDKEGYIYMCVGENDDTRWSHGSDVIVFDSLGNKCGLYEINAGDIALKDGIVTALTTEEGSTDNKGYSVLAVSYPALPEQIVSLPSDKWYPLSHAHGTGDEVFFLSNDGVVRSMAPRNRDFYLDDDGMHIRLKAGSSPAICIRDETEKKVLVYGEEWHDAFYDLNYALRHLMKLGKKVHAEPEQAYNRLRKKQMKKWPRLNIKCDGKTDNYSQYSLYVYGGARKIKMKTDSFNAIHCRSAGTPAPVNKIIMSKDADTSISLSRVKKIKVGGNFTGDIRSYIGKIRNVKIAGSLYNAEITARTDIGILNANGEIENCRVYAGKRLDGSIGMKGNIRKISSSSGMYNSEFIACAHPGSNGKWWEHDAIYRGTLRKVRIGMMRDDEYSGGGGARPGTISQSLIVTKSPVHIIMGRMEECTYIINGTIQ